MTSPSTPAQNASQTGGHSEKRAFPRRLAVRGALVAVALAALGYGTYWWTTARYLESTDDAYVGGDVTVLGPKVPGYIAQVLVTDNQSVHAGDVLVRLDDRDYRAALAKAEGAVAAQQALLANLDATARLQTAVIAQARASVVAVAAEARRAHDDQVRYQDLVAKSAVSVQSAQKADADYKQIAANRDRAEAGAVAAERQLDVIATQKQQAQAALAQAVAERDIARLNLEDTVLRAPVDGTVGNRRARTGAYAQAGTQLLAIVPAHGLWVDANFKEGQVAHLRPGMPVKIEADVLPGRVFHGRVASLAPATGAQFSVLPPENATGNFTKIVQRVPVRVQLDAADGRLGTLRPGLSVTAEVDARGDGSDTSPAPGAAKVAAR
ncbi:HlyD family efflux transporter periplasmic adaptor subunit [Pandoraea fibrosis]|uniref:HlyD family efflux transporter periplasmic adaptor subunit n=1 Tax=Pandoraea fibrosis TaxID=1891094 RepID=A0ABX6HST7_9BURK|nr:HlyD family secretion protein [Pandoraea fibrosis]QHE92474.1 HlyD family efflux transporter periplasmic adaptor subunit [Pandoraea fibrosis]QHF13969.1 HlyD family efflux transporter periplasmic adaptor subunit [Pandoraea fibrosis]